jgi:hypothetical protein
MKNKWIEKSKQDNTVYVLLEDSPPNMVNELEDLLMRSFLFHPIPTEEITIKHITADYGNVLLDIEVKVRPHVDGINTKVTRLDDQKIEREWINW